jgi:hypothetical protein
MNDVITGKDQQLGGKFPQCERNGVDQGVHNVLVHTGALGRLGLKQWGQAEGPVANMQARMARIDCKPVSEPFHEIPTVNRTINVYSKIFPSL